MNIGGEEGPRLRSALLLSQAGLTLAFASVIGFLGGFYLDQWLHTSPWFVLILGAMGVVAGFRELIRTLNRVNAEEDRALAARRGAGMRNAGNEIRDRLREAQATGYGIRDGDRSNGEARPDERQAEDDSERDKPS